jgi:hypothetical protein
MWGTKGAFLLLQGLLAQALTLSKNVIYIAMEIAYRWWKVTKPMLINYQSLSMVMLHEWPFSAIGS